MAQKKLFVEISSGYVCVTYDMAFPEMIRVDRDGSSFNRGGSSMNLLKATTRVDSCLRSTSPRGREVRWLECSRRVVRLVR